MQVGSFIKLSEDKRVKASSPDWSFGWFVGRNMFQFQVNLRAETGMGQIWRGISKKFNLREMMTLALCSVKSGLQSALHHCAAPENNKMQFMPSPSWRCIYCPVFVANLAIQHTPAGFLWRPSVCQSVPNMCCDANEACCFFTATPLFNWTIWSVANLTN